MTSAALAAGLALLLAVAAAPGRAEMTPPARAPRSTVPAPVTPESEFNRGVRAQAARDWASAVAAFRKAVELRPDYAEAWNGLGYALRHERRYPESLEAYDRALRLRPDFPEALEYLGEAYVQMGRLDDARRVLERLRPLDAVRARELADEIAKAR